MIFEISGRKFSVLTYHIIILVLLEFNSKILVEKVSGIPVT